MDIKYFENIRGKISPVILWRCLLVFAGGLFTVLAIHSAGLETPTVDEFAHVPAGYAYLKHGSLDLYEKNPPLMKYIMAMPVFMSSSANVPELNIPKGAWRPWMYGYKFMNANKSNYFRIFFAARMLVILMGLLTGVILFIWIKELFGLMSAAITTSIFFLSPTILAHSHLATIDVACMFTIFLSLFVTRKVYKKPSLAGVSLAGAVWGLALLTKFTAVLLLPVILIFIFYNRLHNKKRAAGEFFLMIICALFIINLGMGMKGSFSRISGFTFKSSFCQSIQNVLPSWFPVPLPENYLSGFDSQKYDTEQGEFGSYLNGKWSRKGWWYYNFVAFAVKTPLPFIILFPVSIFIFFRRKSEWKEVIYIFAPLILITIFMMIFNHLNIGIRYFLPIFPIIFLIIGATWEKLNMGYLRAIPAVILIFYVVTAFGIHPSYLSYFNLPAGGSKKGHNILLDSNLDWGQDLYRLKPWLEDNGYTGTIGLLYFGHVHPEMYGIDYQLIPPKSVAGILAVSVNYIKGYPYPATHPNGNMVIVKPRHLDWLKSFKPVMRLGSIWIFDTRGIMRQ